jgi:hypothetical protein
MHRTGCVGPWANQPAFCEPTHLMPSPNLEKYGPTHVQTYSVLEPIRISPSPPATAPPTKTHARSSLPFARATLDGWVELGISLTGPLEST